MIEGLDVDVESTVTKFLTIEGVDLGDIDAKISEVKAKAKELEKMEDQFNQCVAVIPESDENAIKLTEEIARLKD